MKILRPRQFEVVNYYGILSSSKTMVKAMEQVKKAAASQESILIRGETGTGKELVARMIHSCSPRSEQQYYALNCAAFNRELMTAELFGHKKGAYTGAVQDAAGILKTVNQGTLFLDEIAELDLDLQAKILRVIQEKSYSPIGSTDQYEANVRFVSATHKSLRSQLEKGLFREDLMYRIRVIPIFLPSLREREDDTEMLMWRFIEELNSLGKRKILGIDERAFDCMMAYDWPGNIRELRNNIVYAYYMGEGKHIHCHDLLPELLEAGKSKNPEHEEKIKYEEMVIMDLLKKHQGRKTAVADELGMSRATLWRKLKNMGI